MKALKKNLLDEAKVKVLQNIPLKYIVLDFSCVNYIDNQGVDILKQVKFLSKNEDSKKKVNLVFNLNFYF